MREVLYDVREVLYAVSEVLYAVSEVLYAVREVLYAVSEVLYAVIEPMHRCARLQMRVLVQKLSAGAADRDALLAGLASAHVVPQASA